MKDWIRVVPRAKDVVETAKLLLSLADSPRDVATTAGGMEFLIPPYLADRYNTPAAPKRRRAKQNEEES